jgi:hypothetical protein
MKNKSIHDQLAAGMFCLAFISGCNDSNQSTTYSENVGEFQKIITFNVTLKSIKWEIFDWPEQTGLQLGPTDSTILIAEVEPVGHELFFKLDSGDKTFYPEAAIRPWLSDDFRQLLKSQPDLTLDISRNSNCRPYSAMLTKSKKTVPGFICKSINKVLIYLTLANDMM